MMNIPLTMMNCSLEMMTSVLKMSDFGADLHLWKDADGEPIDLFRAIDPFAGTVTGFEQEDDCIYNARID